MMKKVLLALLCTLALSSISDAATINLSNTPLIPDSYLNYFFGDPNPNVLPLIETNFKLGGEVPDGRIFSAGIEGRFDVPSALGKYIYFFGIEVYESSKSPVKGFSVDFGSKPLDFDFDGTKGNSFWGAGNGWAPNLQNYSNPPASAFFDDLSTAVSFNFEGLQPGTKAAFMMLISDLFKPNLASSFRVWSDGQGPGPAPVPEPATMILLGAGLIGLAGYNRKKFMKF